MDTPRHNKDDIAYHDRNLCTSDSKHNRTGQHEATIPTPSTAPNPLHHSAQSLRLPHTIQTPHFPSALTPKNIRPITRPILIPTLPLPLHPPHPTIKLLTRRTHPPSRHQSGIRIPGPLRAVNPTLGLAALSVGGEVQEGEAVGSAVAGVAASVFGGRGGGGEGVGAGDAGGDGVVELLEAVVVGGGAGGVGGCGGGDGGAGDGDGGGGLGRLFSVRGGGGDEGVMFVWGGWGRG